MTSACDIRVRGIVQGVGFRPHVYRLAQANALNGWISNSADGVQIHLEGAECALDKFVHSLRSGQPPAVSITAIEVQSAGVSGLRGFAIRQSHGGGAPTTRISPDLPVCEECLAELFDPAAKRYHYPYINCTNCGPRYSVILRLPYDRANTTMHVWPLDNYCDSQYRDPLDRRFHAQPVACASCGPAYRLQAGEKTFPEGDPSVAKTVNVLNAGSIVAVKGIGGYHLACDARNVIAVTSLRERKYRKEKPFALMVRSVEEARDLVELSPEAESLLLSVARPIVLARAKSPLPGVAPANDDFGLMLPYTPLHHLLFAAGAPNVLVMTSANRSSEPIAYKEEEAVDRLAGIADAFLVGERPIARRIDDSITRASVFGPMILRRSRGYAPMSVATIALERPILAVGADLKNSITLVVNGQAFVSQHIGDLDQFECLTAFHETIEDLLSMYEVDRDALIIACDAHPQYRSSLAAAALCKAEIRPIQHHRAHVASVLAERGAWDTRVLGVSFDGTGYGDDGTIWGGEFFVGSIFGGFDRVAHLRAADLPGGDSAARYPVQAAAGFLNQLDGLPDLAGSPFFFPRRFKVSQELVRNGVRTFPTTSVGRLFDTAAALLGFTHEATFEGQAAMWVEHQARKAPLAGGYSFPMNKRELDFRPLLSGLARDRVCGRSVAECSRAFQRGFAEGLWNAVEVVCEEYVLDTIVLSGGVFQNEMLLEDLKCLQSHVNLQMWTNRVVPPNDGGISLGQAALAAHASGNR